jgi:predicted O-linked N-acetylglucosamine transferase (SPINDLY family)
MSNAAKVAKLRAKAAELHDAGQLEEAERLYRRVLDRHRSDLKARHMIAVIRLQQGRAGEAQAMLAPLVVEACGDADIRAHHGLALQHLGRNEEALAEFDRALALNSGNGLALLFRGNLLMDAGMFPQALESYDRLLQLAPRYDEAWLRRGLVLWQMDRFEGALASYAKALDSNPSRFSAAFNLGTVLLKLERYDEAFAAFEKARALSPDHPYVLGGLVGAVLGGCDLERWPDFQARIVEAVRDKKAVIVPLDFLPFCDDAALRRQCSETFIADRVPRPAQPLWMGAPYGHERTRIAYLSADFRQHATADLIAGLIERHDRTRFEVGAISFSRNDGSTMRARLIKAFDWFEEVRLKSDTEVAQWLKDREIDIAVDLKGHTQESRPGILAHRPCPVQVGYLGYPGTIGAPWLDYILADARVLPFDRQAFYSEKIVHLPHCYQVNDDGRAIGATPERSEAGLPARGFVFCCFNAGWKLTPQMFDIWMQLLRAVPESILWLLDDNATAKRNLNRRARDRGIDPARLVFAPKIASLAHLARHRVADLFLDTLPYNAHTTASDALWAGLPVLTCPGHEFDGRVAASLLETIGLPELVTRTLEEYEALALALARDPARLGNLRAKLQEMRLTSPLYDTDRFARSLEAAYLRMMEISRTGHAPESFAVPD